MSPIYCSTAVLQTGAGAGGVLYCYCRLGAGHCSIWAKHQGSKTVRIQPGNRHQLQLEGARCWKLEAALNVRCAMLSWAVPGCNKMLIPPNQLLNLTKLKQFVKQQHICCQPSITHHTHPDPPPTAREGEGGLFNLQCCRGVPVVPDYSSYQVSPRLTNSRSLSNLKTIVWESWESAQFGCDCEVNYYLYLLYLVQCRPVVSNYQQQCCHLHQGSVGQ